MYENVTDHGQLIGRDVVGMDTIRFGVDAAREAQTSQLESFPKRMEREMLYCELMIRPTLKLTQFGPDVHERRAVM